MPVSSDHFETIRNEKIQPLVTDLVEAPAGSNLHKILSIMSEKHISELLFPERRRCALISMVEILRCSSIDNTKPTTLIMHVPILTIDATIAQAARIMADYRIKTIPVSDTRKIIGQINGSTILRMLRVALGELKVSSLATQDPITVHPEESVAAARELMIRRRINHLPVKEKDKVIGILTSAQIISVMSPRGRTASTSTKSESHHALDFPVKNIMDTQPLKVSPQTSAEDTLNQMLDTEKTAALITQWEELQGIVTRQNYISLLKEPEIEPEVPVYIVGLPEDPFEAEAAKGKFKRTIKQLHKLLPEIIEARSVIKTKASISGKERKRYEVSVYIKTPKSSYSYTADGWQLAEVYDSITDKLKRLLTQKERRVRERDRERSYP